jgi:hypothetical protein
MALAAGEAAGRGGGTTWVTAVVQTGAVAVATVGALAGSNLAAGLKSPPQIGHQGGELLVHVRQLITLLHRLHWMYDTLHLRPAFQGLRKKMAHCGPYLPRERPTKDRSKS